MPDTRTFDPSSDDPIQEAVRAALGETIRPVQPGAQPKHVASDTPAPPVTQATLGTFTFTSVPRPPAQDGEDEED